MLIASCGVLLVLLSLEPQVSYAVRLSSSNLVRFVAGLQLKEPALTSASHPLLF